MNRFALIALALMAFGLFRDFKKDQGLHNKAKVYHSVLLALLLASYAGSFGILGALMRNFEVVTAPYTVDVGVFSGNVHLVLFVLYTIASLVVLVCAYQMIGRKEGARKGLLISLPILGAVSVFNFYRGWLSAPDELILSDWMILLIGAVVMGGLTFLYLKVYTSRWMKSFFRFIPTETEEMTNVKEG